MKYISSRLNLPLYIISAGLGLVFFYDRKPSYDITISGIGVDSVVSKINSGTFDAADWWTGINRGNPSPIASLIREYEDTVFVLALSSQYFTLVRHDLESLSFELLENVRIVGLKPQSDSPVAPSILPYDDRFNGPISPLPGTLSDYPQRCAVHYVEHVFSSASLYVDRSKVLKLMGKMDWPERVIGRRLSNKEIVDLIKTEHDRTGMAKTKMLRHFRGTLKIACEQKRFATLYDEATGGASAKKN